MQFSISKNRERHERNPKQKKHQGGEKKVRHRGNTHPTNHLPIHNAQQLDRSPTVTQTAHAHHVQTLKTNRLPPLPSLSPSPFPGHSTQTPKFIRARELSCFFAPINQDSRTGFVRMTSTSSITISSSTSTVANHHTRRRMTPRPHRSPIAARDEELSGKPCQVELHRAHGDGHSLCPP